MLYKTKYVKVCTIIFVIVALICLVYVIQGHHAKFNDYLSITCTTCTNSDDEEMITTLLEYIPEKDTVVKKFDFKYTTQYPLGNIDKKNNTVYYTQRDDKQHDQIYSCNLQTKEETQLTTNLKAVNQIIPTDKQVFFVGSSDNDALRLGSIDKASKSIQYWGNPDLNVETITVNYKTKKIYIAAFSYAADRQALASQFDTSNSTYTIPLYTLYETDFAFKNTKQIVSNHLWYRMLSVNPKNNSLLVVYDKDYTVPETSNALYINTKTYEVSNFKLPPQRMQLDGVCFSKDGKGIYCISSINNKRGVYYYDILADKYAPVYVDSKEYVNNIQINFYEKSGN